MAEKRTRPSGSAPAMPPSRNLGVGNAVGNASCGDRHGGGDPLALIVSAGSAQGEAAGSARRIFSAGFPRSAGRRTSSSTPRRPSRSSTARRSPRTSSRKPRGSSCRPWRSSDTNGVYGAPRFYKAAKAAGIKAIVGAEVML